MTEVIKYSNNTIQELSDLDRILKQIIDKRNNNNDTIVAVTVALGDTTDRIANAIYFGNNQTANQVFGLYNDLVNQIGDENLTRFFEKSCRIFERQLPIAGVSKNVDEIQLALGDRLTAYLLHTYLQHAGVNSRLLDVDDPDFPIRLKEGKLQEIDTERSKQIAQDLIRTSANDVLIVPGYAVQNGLIKTLERGGGDISASVIAYAFNANSVWLVADDCLTTTPLPDARVVDEIDLDDAWGAGFFGARLRTPKSVEYLRMLFEEQPNARVYISGKDMGQRKTRINPYAKKKTVRFIASRQIDMYGIRGDFRGLFNILYRTPADWFTYGGRVGELGIGVSERGRDLVDNELMKAERRDEVKVTYHENFTYIGIVGSGMRTTKGIAGRANRALKDINISRSYDPNVSELNSSSIGIILEPKYETAALIALHREFFR